jgi:hypothetical protein
MWRISLLFGIALRFVTLTFGVAAVATLLRYRVAHQPAGVPVEPPSPGPPPVLAQGEDVPKAWSLGGDGWVIRVDGAEVAIPTLLEQTRSRPRSSVAMSISPYDRIIIAHAKSEGFDWRLVAALIYEESRFDPAAESERGAYGLMQVRPIAAAEVGEERFAAPEDNVRTGVRYLRQLDTLLADVPAAERLSFVLAAYNMGPAHLRDAQLLARRFGYDATRWEGHVELMLPLLEQPSIYRDLPAGYAKGRITAEYVRRVLRRYERYLRETPGLYDLNVEALSSSEDGSTG